MISFILFSARFTCYYGSRIIPKNENRKVRNDSIIQLNENLSIDSFSYHYKNSSSLFLEDERQNKSSSYVVNDVNLNSAISFSDDDSRENDILSIKCEPNQEDKKYNFYNSSLVDDFNTVDEISQDISELNNFSGFDGILDTITADNIVLSEKLSEEQENNMKFTLKPYKMSSENANQKFDKTSVSLTKKNDEKVEIIKQDLNYSRTLESQKSTKEYNSKTLINNSVLVSKENPLTSKIHRDVISVKKYGKRKVADNEYTDSNLIKKQRITNKSDTKVVENNGYISSENIIQEFRADSIAFPNQEWFEKFQNKNSFCNNLRTSRKSAKKKKDNPENTKSSSIDKTQVNKKDRKNYIILNKEMMKSIKILACSNLLNENKIKDIHFDSILLSENTAFSKKIFELKEKYFLAGKKDELYCLKFETNLDLGYFDIEDLELKLQEVKKKINDMLVRENKKIKNIVEGLKVWFNQFFEEKFTHPCLEKSSPDIYWEILKIFVELSRDPIFSVVLPEFATFDLKNNINYFKIVEKIDIFGILKFKFIIRTFKFLFLRIKKTIALSSKSGISVFVFNSRYFLRRYLICCFSSIWEKSIMNLYMKLTCFNFNKKLLGKEHMNGNDKIHNMICNKIEYHPSKFYQDNKEILFRFFFQFDLDKFRFSLQTSLLKEEWDKVRKDSNRKRKSIQNESLFVKYFYSNLENFKRCYFLRKKECASEFIETHIKTYSFYVCKNKSMIDEVLLKHDMDKIKFLKDFYDDIKLENNFIFSSKSDNKIDEMKKRNIKSYINEIYQFWSLFDYESIRNLMQ